MSLANVLASTQQSVGAKLEMDLGDGLGLVEIPQFTAATSKGVAADIEIEESLDNIGGDRLTLSLIGADYSPFTSDALRGKRQVRLTGYHARPGETLTYSNAFNGYVFGSEFGVFPPTSRLTVLDAMQAYNTPLVYELAPGHGKTRAEIVTAICALSPAIPTGTITLGSRGGVALQKPISEGGTRGRFEFLAEFLGSCDVRIFFSAGSLQILPHNAAASSVRMITGDLVCPDGASVQVPDFSRATKTTVTSTSLSVTAVGSTRTETETETITANYAPVGSVQKQAATTGVITDHDGSLPEASREVYKRETSRTYDGATLTAESITEWGWYARKAARRLYSWDGLGDPILDGTYTYPASDLYLYADGEWYYDECESYRIIRQTVMTRNFDDDGYLSNTVENKYCYHFIRKPLLVTKTGGDLDFSGSPVNILESDEGTTYIREQIGLAADRNAVDERVTTRYYRSTNGQLARVTTTTEAFGIGARTTSTTTVGGVHVYGLRNRIYASATSETLGGSLSTTEESYKQWSQTRYTATKSLRIKGGAPAAAGDYTEPTTVEERIGSAPFCEKKEAYEETAAVTSSVTDSVRVAINGTIETVVENQWCESTDDCASYAASVQRDESAVNVTVETPFAWDIHKNDWVTIDIPDAGISSVKMFVYGVRRSLSNYRMTLNLLWYPAEVI